MARQAQQQSLDGIRVWIVVVVSALGAWLVLLLVHPSLAMLSMQTYWCSESSIHFWQLRHHGFVVSTMIAAAFGNASAFNLWFLSYQDLREFPRLERWLNNHVVMNGRYFDGWLRYAVAASVMVFFAIVSGVILARRLDANKWITLGIVFGACTVRNFFWGWFLLFIPQRGQTIASIIVLGVVAAITLKDVKGIAARPAAPPAAIHGP